MIHFFFPTYRFETPRWRRASRIADQQKINSLNGQLQRAKARKDKHLVKQIEASLRLLNNG